MFKVQGFSDAAREAAASEAGTVGNEHDLAEGKTSRSRQLSCLSESLLPASEVGALGSYLDCPMGFLDHYVFYNAISTSYPVESPLSFGSP